MAPPNGFPLNNGDMYITPLSGKEELLYGDEVENRTQVAAASLGKSDDLCMEEVSSAGGDAEAALVVPPDGGWGWVVVMASFCCNMVVDGIIFSYGMFITDITKDFEVSRAQVTLVGSLLSGFYLIAGPFVSALANRYGFRLVAIVGSVVGAAAFVLSAFSTSIEFLFISYGIIGGIGFGMVYVPAVITVGFYFEKWRALATGIAVCGSGIGTFLFAPISSMLIDAFGWRNALIVQAGLVLSCGIFGAMFRPIKPVKVGVDSQSASESTESAKDATCEKEVPLLMRIKMSRERSGMRTMTDSTVSLSNTRARANKEYPTAEEYLGKSTTSVNMCKSTMSLHAREFLLKNPVVAKLSKSEKRLSTPVLSDNLRFAAETMQVGGVKGGKAGACCDPLLTAPAKMPPHIERRHTMGERRMHAFTEGADTDANAATVQRPFYRDDIFFGASLLRLPQYTSHTSLGYHLSVTRLPTSNDVAEEKRRGCKLCPEAVTRTLNTMLDLSLLRSPSFILLAISGFFTMMGFYVPFMFLTDRAQRNGMELGTAMWLISTIGIANTVGRVLCGVITSFPGCNAMLINNISITISGIATLTSGLSYSEEYQFIYAVVFGLTISCFASLRSVLIVELVGLERLTNAFGLILLFQGIAAAAGAPIACAFMEATKSDDISFYLSGTLITLSALLCFPVSWINRWEKRQAEAASDVVV